tara:strand:+ start:1202 stop:1867 length:666 start_codon:yes stop_codon:yes gene_type:complete
MKKVLLLTMSVCVLHAGYSVYGGMAYTGANIKYATEVGVENKTNSVPGMTVGASMDAGPVKVGAAFTQRAFEMESSFAGVMGYRTKMTQNFLEFWTAYPYEAGPVVLFGGFMVGMPMGDGKGSMTMFVGDTDSPAVDFDLKATCADTDMTCMESHPTALDYGIMFGATYPINDNMSATAGYYMGLADFDDSAAYEGYVASEDDGTGNGPWNSIFTTVSYSF